MNRAKIVDQVTADQQRFRDIFSPNEYGIKT